MRRSTVSSRSNILNLEKLSECKEDTIDPSTGITAGQISFHYHFQQHSNGIRKENPVRGVDVEDRSALELPSVPTILPTTTEFDLETYLVENNYMEYCRRRLEEREINCNFLND